MKFDNTVIRYVISVTKKWLRDFFNVFGKIIKISIMILCFITILLDAFLIWYCKCKYNKCIMIVLIFMEAILWGYPVIKILIYSCKTQKYLLEENPKIENSNGEKDEDFSSLLNRIRKSRMYKGIFWELEVPVEDINNEVKESICEFIKKYYGDEFNFSSFEKSKEYIEKLMCNADGELFTDALAKKPDGQEYFCFDNSFLEYVDAFSPVLVKHHKLYEIEKYEGKIENEKKSK